MLAQQHGSSAPACMPLAAPGRASTYTGTKSCLRACCKSFVRCLACAHAEAMQMAINADSTASAGLGMNREELRKNNVLTDYDVVDLNETPKLCVFALLLNASPHKHGCLAWHMHG